MTAPTPDVRDVLLAQLDLVRRFGAVALDGLTDDEALWRPGPRSWTVRPVGDGTLLRMPRRAAAGSGPDDARTT